jgi:hypothetical protein
LLSLINSFTKRHKCELKLSLDVYTYFNESLELYCSFYLVNNTTEISGPICLNLHQNEWQKFNINLNIRFSKSLSVLKTLNSAYFKSKDLKRKDPTSASLNEKFMIILHKWTYYYNWFYVLFQIIFWFLIVLIIVYTTKNSYKQSG